MFSQASASLRAAAAGAVLGLLGGCVQAQEGAVAIPPPAFDETPSGVASTAVAVLAGGCFWGVQGVYQHVEGVLAAVSGYAGGAKDSAQYELVGSGSTGHAEAVEITYDPTKITYGKLLEIYFSVVHDPTQLDRQGPDRGPQYRSTIFPADAHQREIAEKYIAQLDGARSFAKEIVTTLEDGRTFYPAETYHQDFLVRNPRYPYVVIHDLPKVRNLAAAFPDVYRSEPVLVLPRSAPPHAPR
jgi:peptide-methionine (S)-S-oxide reductase